MDLFVRPGARFTCHADGVCCTDMHALGPVLPREIVPLRRLHRRPVVSDPTVQGAALATTARGQCVFLRPDRLCDVHAELGVEQKPAVCRRHPHHLVLVPGGFRVFTPHRCTCRTLGERAPLDPATVRAEITVRGVPLRPEHTVTTVALADGRPLPWSRWRAFEARLMRRIAASPERAVGAAAFPRLRDRTWEDVAETFQDADDDSSFEQAKAWVGDAIAALREELPFPGRPRPWLRFFARVARRVPRVESPRAMLADWLADEVWSLEFTRRGSFARGRRDLATRVAIVGALARAFHRRGGRADFAMAEALLVMDVVGHSEHWEEVARATQTA